MVLIYSETIEEDMVWFLPSRRGASCDFHHWWVCVHCINVHNKGAWWQQGRDSWRIYLLTVSLESEPWVPAKDDKGLHNLCYKVSSWWVCGRHVQIAAGKSWVICMPQSLLIGSGWQRKQILQQIENLVLSPWDLIASHYKFKNQHQYFKPFSQCFSGQKS